MINNTKKLSELEKNKIKESIKEFFKKPNLFNNINNKLDNINQSYNYLNNQKK